jgi:O-antigen ligase
MFENLNFKLSKNFFFIFIPSFLTILLPFFLLTGPFLPDLAISLCGILFIINFFSNSFNNLRQYFNSKFFIFFILFWITIIFSSLISSHVAYSLETSFFYIRFGFFVLSTWFLLENNKKFIFFFYYSLILCISILVFDGFIQFFLGKNIFGWPIIDTRVSSFFKDELIMGSYLSRLIPLCFAIFIYLDQAKPKKINKLIYITVFILAEVLIFLSGERASFFYITLSSIFVIFLLKNYKKVRILILILSLTFFCVLSVFDNRFKKRIVDQTLDQIGILKKENNNSKGFYIFSLEHENHYKSAYLMFKENKLLGVGPKLFRKNCNKEEFLVSNQSCSTHPHNTYVQLLAEVGILGFLQIFIIFIFLVYISFKHLFLKINKSIFLLSDFQISILSCILITLWPFIPTGNFFGNWINVIYYLPVGFLLFSFNMNKKNRVILK